MTTILNVSLLLLITYIFGYYYKYFTRISPCPGPFPLPFIGNMLELFKVGGDFVAMSINMHKKYGDMWEFYAFSERQIWLSRTKFIAKFYDKKLTKDLYFQRVPDSPGLRDIGVNSHGVAFISDYQKWRINRKFLIQALLTTKFKNGLIPTIQTVIAGLEKMWLRLDHKKPIDMAKWSAHITSDLMFRVSLHHDLKITAEYFNTFVPDEEKIPELPSNQKFEAGFVELAQTYIPTVFFLVLFPAWVRHYVPWFSQKNTRVIKDYQELLNRVETQIVKKRRAEIENMPMEQDMPSDLLTQLCIINTPRSEAKIDNGKPMTDEEICRIMNDAFVAGTDTTAHTMCFIIYYLCKHPHVKARLVKELEAVFGSNFDKSITPQHLAKLTYFDAIIREVNRINPTINCLSRMASAEAEVGGNGFPPGTMFMLDMLNRNRHPEEWSDAQEFIPERWLGSDAETSKQAFTFGGGVRECPGRYLAETEIKVILAMLYMKFDIKLANENENLKCFSDSTLVRCLELKVFIEPKC